ncbi:TetR/AcrR family transcriptional regulator [Kribbella sp. NPDC056345]|uniref:TetR/AcrR family transcriptional regulator n=1 Tax=Kribbella sp. NPDC056345 TaxID=3345789 RepID=UPI0035E081B3
MTVELSRSLRADAADNRERIVEAAYRLFAAEGMTVTMREIARQAGVGPATLYRHFPTKQDLAVEVFAEQVRICHQVVDDGLAEPDPWTGFCQVIERICEQNAQSRGFTEAFLATYPELADLRTHREHTLGVVAELAKRAKKSGQLRADFTLDDLILMLSAHRSIPGRTPQIRRTASRRFAALTIEAFRARF